MEQQYKKHNIKHYWFLICKSNQMCINEISFFGWSHFAQNQYYLVFIRVVMNYAGGGYENVTEKHP